MGNKLTDALRGGNFKPANVRQIEEPTISKAEAAGLRPPPLSAAQREGINAASAVAGNKFSDYIATRERYEREKAEYERKLDDALWARIQARRIV
jgi:hypothetical protein